MELRTQSVDRILEALAPSIAVELERILNEARSIQATEFESRLQSAVGEAVTAAQAAAAAELQTAVAQAGENARRLATEELQTQFEQTLRESNSQHVATSEAELQKASAQWDERRLAMEGQIEALRKVSEAWDGDRIHLEGQIAEWKTFAEAQRRMADSASQSELLTQFLQMTELFARAIAIYTLKTEGLELWKVRGSAVFPPIVSLETIDPEFYFRQIIVRGKVVAAFCAAQPCRPDALDSMAASLEQAVTLFGLRLRMPLPDALQSPAPTRAPAGNDESEARRTARLVVSEIKLYHEQQVRAGRANSDLYQRLRPAIEGGREQYRQRVPAAMLGRHDYFHEQLVRILAENNPALLGADDPGPMNS